MPLLQPALRLAVSASPDRVTPPDAVTATVTWDAAAAGDDVRLVAGVELLFAHGYKSAGGFGKREYRFQLLADDVSVAYDVPPREPVEVTGDGTASVPLFVPVTRPSVDIPGLHLTHAVRVDAVTRDGRVVATARAPFAVVLPAGGYPQAARTVAETSGADFGLRLSLRDRHVRSGGRVHGVVGVPAGARRVGVALVRSLFLSQLGHDDQRFRTDKTIVSANVAHSPGSDAAFSLDVPADACPTLFAGPCALRWFVRATAAAGRTPWGRSQRYELEVELSNA